MLQNRMFQVLPLAILCMISLTFFGCEEDESVLHTLSIKVEPQEGGVVEGMGTYESGSDVTITATANDGYTFLNWTDDDQVISNETEFVYTMPPRDVMLTANFIVKDGTTGVVSDIDGNEYETIYIGGRKWMAENLRTTRYHDGTEIPSGLNVEEWEATIEGAYSVHPHDEVVGIDSPGEMVDAYGKLYNWYAVDDDRGLCPEGWQVFSAYDWDELMDYFMDHYDFPAPNVAHLFKSRRQVGSPLGGAFDTETHPRWNAHDTNYGTDEFGFSALPAASRHSYGEFSNEIGITGRFWTSTETDQGQAVRWYLSYDSNEMYWGFDVYKQAGLSVRCVRKQR